MTTERKMPELGKIEKMDIRGIWRNEAQDFTPWLFQNIELLGDALGLNLEALDQEVPVGRGRFKLDVLARVEGTADEVAVENQLEQTDNPHLGQLLTYTAGRKAKVAVWIAESFREEHITALDLLNTQTDTGTQFFGVKIEAVKIGESLPAPMFEVVAAPNGWAKEVIKTRTASEQKYTDFFQPLVSTLTKDHKLLRITKPAYYSRGISASHSGLSYRISFFTQGGGKHRIELYIDRGDKPLNEAVFNKLHEQKQDIESALGKSHTWDWEHTTRGTSCRISITRDGGIDEENKHDDIRKWMVDHLLKFKEVFDPRLVPIFEEFAE